MIKKIGRNPNKNSTLENTTKSHSIFRLSYTKELSHVLRT